MVTFSKRRQGGLFKKAKQLSILYGCEIAIVTFSGAGKAFTFGSLDPDTVIRRYLTPTSIPSSIKDHPKDQMAMFSKRRQSLFKKAKELSILCGCEIAILTFDGAGNVFTFRLPDPDAVIRRYISHTSIPNSSIKNHQRQPKHLVDVMDSAEQQSEDDLASPKRVVLEHVSDRVLVSLKEISCLSPTRFGFVFSSSACYFSAATSTTFIWIRYQYGLPSSACMMIDVGFIHNWMEKELLYRLSFRLYKKKDLDLGHLLVQQRKGSRYLWMLLGFNLITN